MSERRLVTIERVLAVKPIANADAIEIVQVRGWNVVVRKGEFAVGDACVYFEIDSFLPISDPRFAFLATRNVKTVNGALGHVLKTMKLRKVCSQGLVMSVADFPELNDTCPDMSAVLGIFKYEPPIPAELNGLCAGVFASQFAPKTNAERVQNLVEVFDVLHDNGSWIATEKIDGSSVTYINDAGVLRVCTRNWELDASHETTQWLVAKELDILATLAPGWALQGEMYGVGIHSNILKVTGHRFAAFALWENRELVPRAKWPEKFLKMAAPVFDLELPETVEATIALSDGIKSLINPERLAEGIVWHETNGKMFDELDGRGCFKAISNAFLVKQSS
jgi:RNA ligase (TIGR02306 family)